MDKIELWFNLLDVKMTKDKTKYVVQNTLTMRGSLIMTSDNNENLVIYSPDSNPYGISYSEWTARWWQWLMSIPTEINPVNDKIGKDCAINQSGPVWFLAGTAGGEAERSCTIPAGNSILMPILNYGATFADEPTIKSDQQLQSLAKNEMDKVSDLAVTFDGVELEGIQEYRVQSPIFDIVLPKNNLFGGVPGPTRGISDGYWLFLGSFHKSNHKIHSFGSCLSGKVRIGASYDITVT